MKFPKLPNGVYDILKWIVLIFLPACSTAVFALSAIYGFDPAKICGTIGVAEAFIGALIGLSTISYNKSLKEDNSND